MESSIAGSLPPDYMDLDEFLVASGVKLDVSTSAFETRVVQKKVEVVVQHDILKEVKSEKNTEAKRNDNNIDAKNNRNTVSEDKIVKATTDSSDKSKDVEDYRYNYNPLPMKRKAQRQFVTDTKKDDRYWKRRNRNNEAARRSRDMRRQREIEISTQCRELETENARLKKELQKLKEKANKLEKQLSEK